MIESFLGLKTVNHKYQNEFCEETLFVINNGTYKTISGIPTTTIKII